MHVCMISAGGWAPSIPANSWIQADLGVASLIHDVITQSHDSIVEWVTSYRIASSQDGVSWDEIAVNFTANTDMQTKVVNELPAGTVAQFVRLLPLTYHRYPSLRWELVGCFGQGTHMKSAIFLILYICVRKNCFFL